MSGLNGAAKLRAIKRRIRQLRRMTVTNGCTESEASRAAEIALRLMDRYALDEGDIVYDRAEAPTMGSRRQTADSLWPQVARVCRCKGWIERTDRTRFVYFGSEGNVAIAEYLHELLAGGIRRESVLFRKSPTYLRRRKRATRNAAMKDFQEAMVLRLAQRLADLWWTHSAEASADIERVERAMAACGVALRTMKPLQPPKRRDHDARWSGHSAGGQVALDPGVAGTAETRLLGTRGSQ